MHVLFSISLTLGSKITGRALLWPPTSRSVTEAISSSFRDQLIPSVPPLSNPSSSSIVHFMGQRVIPGYSIAVGRQRPSHPADRNSIDD